MSMTLPVIPSNPSPYPRGTYAKIARRLNVTVQTVSEVARGRTTSARIAAELRKELRNAERRAERERARTERQGAA